LLILAVFLTNTPFFANNFGKNIFKNHSIGPWTRLKKLLAALSFFPTFQICQKCLHAKPRPRRQGCQMVYFQTKNSNLGKFWRALEWKRLVYFIFVWNILRPLWYILWPFCNLVAIWYIFPRFGILCQE
jgi:hypothetical protein